MIRIASSRFPALFLGFLFFASGAFAQKKDYQGLLWEITGNGLKKPSYLYGTMHVSNKVAFHLTDSFFNGLRGADVIALESDPGTWMDEMLDPEFLSGFMNKYYGYKGPYSEGFYEKAFAMEFPEKNAIARMFAEENETLNGMLYRMTPMAENYQENTYLDLFIYQTGKKDKKVVTNLEDFDETMRLYKKAMKPEKGEKMNYGGMSKLMQKGLNFYEMLEDAYRKGDLDLIDSLNTITAPTKNYRRYFLDQRNKIMADGMDSILQKNLTLFTAVGAAHLPGDSMGMISLLRQKGYRVRAVNGIVTRSSMMQKDKIEKVFLPQTYITRFSPDSAFQVDMPGKLYEMPGGGDQRLYLYPEMVNGGYFSVSRMKTYGALRGKNPEYIAASIDSMLYENIPGKILKRTSIRSNSGYPGFDISSKTRSGDNLRYKIFVSPQEVFVFMVGGRGDYARRKEVEKFFNSIRFTRASSANWKKISPENGGFEVEVPGIVLHDEPMYSFQNDKLHAYDPNEQAYYLFIKATLQDLNYIEEDTFELNQLAQEFAEQLNYTLEEKSLASFQKYPALDMTLKSKATDVTMKGKIIIRGAHYYLITTTALSESSQKKFFNSFRLTGPKYKDTFFVETDSAIFARVTLAKKPKDKEELSEDMASYSYDYANEEEEEDEDKSYEGAYATQWYYSEKTDEAISVDYSRFHKYYEVENKDTFWKEKIDFLTESNVLIVKSKTFADSDSLAEMNLVLTDTASARAIIVRMLMKNGTFYTLSTLSDTLTKPSLWVSTFFESFEPLDSAIGQSPFTDKTTLFLSDLQSSDTTLQKQAKKSIEVFHANFEKKHSPDLIKYLKSDAFKKLDVDKRIKLIAVLGNVEDPESVAILKKLYAGASDSVAQQIAILRALGWQQTEKSFGAFTELLEAETPLTSDESEIDNLFFPFYDTLPLARKLYPRLLEFTTYPEYKSQVYSLLATLVDSGYVKKELYAVYKKRILKEANEELRRQFASEEKEKIGSEGSSYNNEYSDYVDYAYDYAYTNQYDYGNPTIYNYTVLLIPYYHEPLVKAYFDKLKKSQDKGLRLGTSLLLLRNNLPVHDSVWASYAKDDSWKIRLYSELKEAKRLDKFNDSFKNQLDFARAGLYGGVSKKDTVAFIGKRFVENRYKKGYVYFFKRRVKEEEGDMWKLEYIGPQPADTMQVEAENFYVEKFEYEVSEDESEIDDKIDEIVKQLCLEGRKRVSQKKSYEGYDYYDY